MGVIVSAIVADAMKLLVKVVFGNRCLITTQMVISREEALKRIKLKFFKIPERFFKYSKQVTNVPLYGPNIYSFV